MIPIEVRDADWKSDGEAIREIRTEVFIREQEVPEELEWDGMDSKCRHALVYVGGDPVATGRITPDGQIGRMAVLADYRGSGAGMALLRHLIDAARDQGHDRVFLHAQTSALSFYERAGFQAYGPEFDDAGIPHQAMALELDDVGDADGG